MESRRTKSGAAVPRHYVSKWWSAVSACIRGFSFSFTLAKGRLFVKEMLVLL